MSDANGKLTCVRCFGPDADNIELTYHGKGFATVALCAACLGKVDTEEREERAVFEELIAVGQCEYNANRGMFAKCAQSDGAFDVPKNGPAWRGLICWPKSSDLFAL